MRAAAVAPSRRLVDDTIGAMRTPVPDATLRRPPSWSVRSTAAPEQRTGVARVRTTLWRGSFYFSCCFRPARLTRPYSSPSATVSPRTLHDALRVSLARSLRRTVDCGPWPRAAGMRAPADGRCARRRGPSSSWARPRFSSDSLECGAPRSGRGERHRGRSPAKHLMHAEFCPCGRARLMGRGAKHLREEFESM